MGGGHTQGPFDLKYYVNASLAGAICCSVTHGALCPVIRTFDVAKTRVNLDPAKYNQGMITAFRQVIAAEGVGALATGLGPTVGGYFVQGWFKFGGVELVKTQMATYLGEKKAWQNRNAIYLTAAASAEFAVGMFICPLEATRIRLVSNPSFGNGLGDVMSKILAQDGFIKGFFSGFGPFLFKQVPYTMAQFAVQGWAAEQISTVTGTPLEKQTGALKMHVALASGTIAGVAAAVVSHPADTLLAQVNKTGAGGNGSISSRLLNLAKAAGIKKLCLTGLGSRCVMIGMLTAGQFALFDTVMDAVGAQKFHFVAPSTGHH
jgi:solute carrier family 25 phosphate transporter 3